MKIPGDAIIPAEKFTHYLLVEREYDDKSKFLSIAGFNNSNYEKLISEIKILINKYEASKGKSSDFGTFYTVTGSIIGINKISLNVATVWIKRNIDNKFQFITLIPERRD